MELNWIKEVAPDWDSTGTVKASWTAEAGQLVCRIDEFTEGGYAYSVSRDGDYLPGAENEAADSWEQAEEKILEITQGSRKQIRFTVTIDDELWHQVGIRAAQMRMTKRAFLEEALREKLDR